ncbi:UDP-N-acetyl-D-mannosaminuronic acid transferase [Clostridium carboxidivorans P7]|uniref:N-acetylglucosaminyldiphosphoundecaprenol N-acetyl-beta-D-mannosaminyltransferase n=1 Tax=Clostridium carboxidivorans P7 TaxID=536227 RepID=C6PW87_9CLOT|nr:WecB/TagA/CpsF family glycosyltransferase [Clostridium carboxidivorans]AKN32502.1 UDP-N-acetyl-D-mannosaminuronic acid transferase [Clostridium carboxidivorans P7]EET86501.1 glycosyl transferase, WecB/TagA/CpsF family [Clostridium carboxidivorans P7]EFG87773.1 glycosyl transferase, WecB/TagA/CpsF family [Clostridium carboxidivorans P7]
MFTRILEYNVFNGTLKELMNYIEKFNKVNIISGNPEVLYNGLNNPLLFNNFTGDNSIIIPDGVGTVMASKVVKNPVKEKIAGIELMEEIVKKCEREGKSIYLIGAKQEILDACIEKLQSKYTKLNISGSHNGYFDLNNCSDLIDDIKAKKPYALFIAMGSPRQDVFIIKNMKELPCKIFMGVGGSFDVFAGKVKRAPNWMIKLGLEWLYRVAKEPFRVKRLGSIPKFLLEVIKHKSK